MQPVVCFYENTQLILSTDYQLISCPDDMNVIDFFDNIKQRFSDKMKIVKINFAALEDIQQDHRKSYFKTAKADVFVLHNYELTNEVDLEKKYPHHVTSRPAYSPTLRQNAFMEKVQSIKEDICRGRFYQMNYTAAVEARMPERYSTFHNFVQQSQTVGCDYRAYLPLGPEQALTCLSPELFLRKKGSLVTTQPIKGTLLSGSALKELQQSPKETAELSMIVDLLRNDLNTLSCDTYNDSARVNFHRKILDLKYTAHTYSEIEINTSKKFSEIIAKTFPGGSISGCPKKESLTKIAETEDYHRDFYTGSIGWWKNDDFCLNIAIRTYFREKNNLYYFTGCGIVFDSDPHKEWHEFLTKCSFLNIYVPYTPILDTLHLTQNGFSYLDEHVERTYLALRDQQIQA